MELRDDPKPIRANDMNKPKTTEEAAEWLRLTGLAEKTMGYPTAAAILGEDRSSPVTGSASEPRPDANVEAVREKLRQRAEVGLRKYGVTTERTDMGLVDWLRHAQEEALDQAVYLEAAIKAASSPTPRSATPPTTRVERTANNRKHYEQET
jgi:hypothetical protein